MGYSGSMVEIVRHPAEDRETKMRALLDPLRAISLVAKADALHA